MWQLQLQGPGGRAPRVVCIGAHCDDIEIGCGATLLQLREAWPEAEIHWLVLSSNAQRRAETEVAARRLLGAAALPRVVFGKFRDGFLPYEGASVKEFFEDAKARVSPDVILTHQRSDLHQDHRIACELTWNTWRDQLVLEYEIPKYDGDLGRPNVFVALEREQLETKIAILEEAYASQRAKSWFTPETFRGLARLRGIEANAPSGYAEAFYGPKLLLRPSRER
jgi:LmbE family N-acetylglucosaminyl deacetylase